jgi:hypothetical protein
MQPIKLHLSDCAIFATQAQTVGVYISTVICYYFISPYFHAQGLGHNESHPRAQCDDISPKLNTT